MKTVLALRNNYSGSYIFYSLASKGKVDAVLWETGSKARQKKILEKFKNLRGFLDLSALQLFNIYVNRGIKRHLSNHLFLQYKKKHYDIIQKQVNDINSNEANEFLKNIEPDCMIVYGTSLIGKSILQIPNKVCLNIHSGVVPAYRNVHSEAWALLRNDYEQIGCSLLHLDLGIDTGKIAFQKCLHDKVVQLNTFPYIKSLNLRLGAKLADKALNTQPYKLPRIPQDKTYNGFYSTLGCMEIVKLLKRDWSISKFNLKKKYYD